MDHLAMHSSCEADLGPIEEEELVNILLPSSPQSTQMAILDSSAVDQASRTSDAIPGDEDVELIMTVDEYYDAHSTTSSISSLITLKSSFCQMPSATRASLTSASSI